MRGYAQRHSKLLHERLQIVVLRRGDASIRTTHDIHAQMHLHLGHDTYHKALLQQHHHHIETLLAATGQDDVIDVDDHVDGMG